MNLLVIISSKPFGQSKIDFIQCGLSLFLGPCRTYGIEPALIDVILDILINHLHNSSNDSLDVHTVRTIAQFMIERKNIIVPLLEFTLKCQPVELFTDWIP